LHIREEIKKTEDLLNSRHRKGTEGQHKPQDGLQILELQLTRETLLSKVKIKERKKQRKKLKGRERYKQILKDLEPKAELDIDNISVDTTRRVVSNTGRIKNIRFGKIIPQLLVGHGRK